MNCIDLTALNGNFESEIYRHIFEAYEKHNGEEYFIIIMLMKAYSPARKTAITNALILINSLFFVPKNRFKNGKDDNMYARSILKSICV